MTATDDKGGFAGWARPADAAGVPVRAAAWTNGTYTDLGTAGTGTSHTYVTAENRAGALAGTARTSAFGVVVEKAFKSSGGTLVELPLPTSASPAPATSSASCASRTGRA
ncbi:hypothetical protein [Amycolatopsis sp.]|uniref:hypothetical protein n=1 Tax=Amycolatopsis sp. TaxID=37632 RepID=UPI002D7F2D70|nr:hypothetical protein [Amycolatopsis sp.]HET6707680.1 hypothetical protein [Amycolatopsis sp.]